ncbi:MAG: hypothetical protein ACOCWQ_00785 [Nanoarchaeota archaeon]
MVNNVFGNGVRMLQEWGVMDILLPFFLVFAIVFAVLQKAKPLGKKSKKFNVIIALIMGMAVIFPHVLNPGGRYDVVPIINRALPHVSIVLIAIVMMMLILGLLGSRVNIGGKSLSGWVMVIALVIIVYIFGSAAGWFWRLPYWLDNPQTIAVVITILVFAIVISYITQDEDANKDKDGIGKKLGELLESADE